LSTILNIDLSDDNWPQASLPVKNGGLGIRSVTTPAPSAFLASAASTLTLRDVMLAQFGNICPDPAVTRSTLAWSAMANDVEPVSERRHIQKAWDGVVTLKQQNSLLLKATSSIDQARLLATVSAHAGDWLHAAPISSISLRLSNEAIRGAEGLRLGINTCQPHECPYGKQVDARGLHGLAFRKATARQQQHSHLNEILWRSIKRAQVPATREPVGLFRSDGKRPDGSTQIPWARGKPLAWDVTVPDTYADSHINVWTEPSTRRISDHG